MGTRPNNIYNLQCYVFYQFSIGNGIDKLGFNKTESAVFNLEWLSLSEYSFLSQVMNHKKGNYDVCQYNSSQPSNVVSELPPPLAYTELSSVILTGLLIHGGSSQLYGSNDVHVHQGIKMTSLPLVHLGSYQVTVFIAEILIFSYYEFIHNLERSIRTYQIISAYFQRYVYI